MPVNAPHEIFRMEVVVRPHGNGIDASRNAPDRRKTALYSRVNERSLMREMKRIGVAEIERDVEQPRKHFDEQELLALGQNMLAHAQQVPVIVYCPDVAPGDRLAKRYRLLDGERRWRGAQLAGIAELDALVLAQKPSQAALHLLQMSLEAHKQGFTAMERSHLLCRIRTENNWQITELAEKLHMKQPMVSKLLAYQKLDPAIQAMLHRGELDMAKAFIISQEPDPAKQRELTDAAPLLDRDQLRRRAKGEGFVDHAPRRHLHHALF
jgi:ParB/RepB/Spo0J family partition protein